jgi:MFS transporter, ACS family, D-galactonate transporter
LVDEILVAGNVPSDTKVPARRRIGIVALLMAIVFTGHFNRISIATAGDTRIMRQYDIAPERMGLVYSALLLMYTLCMIPAGLFIDRFGPRVALAVLGIGSAFFVAMTGAVGLLLRDGGAVFFGLVVVRGLLGVVFSPLHPGSARAVGLWVPSDWRSRTNGLVNGSALLGIAVTPLVFGALIDRVDWPFAFVIAGGFTAVLALIWMTLATDQPHPTEAPLVANVPETNVESLRDLFTRRSLVLLTLSYGAVGYFQYLFFYWMTYYFQTVLELPERQSRFYAAIPPLAMAAGMPLGGWLSDRLERTIATPRSRCIVPMAGMTAGALLLTLGAFAQEPAWIVFWFALALGAVGASEGPFWATAVELGGRRGGSSAAFFNTGGNAGGMLAPVITPLIGRQFGWGYAVGVGALVCLVGVVLWFWIDPRERSDNCR